MANWPPPAFPAAFLMRLRPDVQQHLRRDHEAEQARAIDIVDLRGRLGGRIQRHIGDAQPLLGQVDGKWRLGRARDPQKHDVGLREVLGILAVVVGDGELQGADALEVVVIHHAQHTGLAHRLHAAHLGDGGNGGGEHVDGHNVGCSAKKPCNGSRMSALTSVYMTSMRSSPSTSS